MKYQVPLGEWLVLLAAHLSPHPLGPWLRPGPMGLPRKASAGGRSGSSPGVTSSAAQGLVF